jgi:hypothetical protein
MANGGIPVSGGSTGHGTLISTNLLYSPLLLDAYGCAQARPSFTIGGTAGAAGYEAAFIMDKDSKTLYKTPASAGAITLTMTPASVLQAYGIVLVGHNLTAAGITSAKLEGGVGNYTDFSKDLVLNVATLTPAHYLLSTAEIAAAANYNQWRITVTFASSAALQIGEAFLIGAPPLAFAKNYQWRPTDDLEIGKVSSMGISGVPRMVAQWERKRMDLTFQGISTAQLTAMQVAARNGHVIFSPESSDSFAYFGIWEMEPPTHVYFDMWDVVAHFTESPK